MTCAGLPPGPHVHVMDFSSGGGTGHSQVSSLNPRAASWRVGTSCSSAVVGADHRGGYGARGPEHTLQ